jgi:hypothetical protein
MTGRARTETLTIKRIVPRGFDSSREPRYLISLRDADGTLGAIVENDGSFSCYRTLKRAVPYSRPGPLALRDLDAWFEPFVSTLLMVLRPHW